MFSSISFSKITFSVVSFLFDIDEPVSIHTKAPRERLIADKNEMRTYHDEP